MKSSYELAMERLSKSAPAPKLTAAQKAELGELDSKYAAKIAEREIFVKSEIAKACLRLHVRPSLGDAPQTLTVRAGEDVGARRFIGAASPPSVQDGDRLRIERHSSRLRTLRPAAFNRQASPDPVDVCPPQIEQLTAA